MTSFKLFLEELRAPFFTATVIPVILGTAIAWQRLNAFNLFYFILTLFGVVCLHAGTNVINDYFDHKSGNDFANTEFIRPFTGGSRLIQNKLLSENQVLFEALILFAIGGSIGIYLSFLKGPMILLFGIIGVFSGFFYSAPPFRFSGSGIGELLVAFNFGVLVVLGSYFVQTGQLALEPVLSALPISFLVAAILYINEFPDYTADKKVGKNNLVVRLGKEKAMFGYILLMLLPFIFTIFFSISKLISPFNFLIFLAFPQAVKTIKAAKLNYNKGHLLIAANAGTVICHLQIGVLGFIGYIIQKFIFG